LSLEMSSVAAHLQMKKSSNAEHHPLVEEECDEKLDDAVNLIVEQQKSVGIKIGDLLNCEVKKAPKVQQTPPSIIGSWHQKRSKLTIDDFYEDKELFDCLLQFMRRIYCSESIQFLSAVQKYKKEVSGIIEEMEGDPDEEVDFETTLQEHDRMEQVIDARAGHIFNQFIVPDTPHQNRSI